MKKVLLASITALLPQIAWAWGDLGHATVAEIAERHILPTTKVMIEEILGPQPLSAAATWPDQVRFDKRFKNLDDYHLLEIPPGVSFRSIPSNRLAPRSAHVVLSEFPKLFQQSYADEQTRLHTLQIALRYIVHVIGDIHQPLHVGNGLDHGANLCQVILVDRFNGERLTNLHTLWDEDILGHMKALERERLVGAARQSAANSGIATPPPKRYYEAINVADLLEAKLPQIFNSATQAAIRQIDLPTWYDDSVFVRTAQCYPDAEARFSPPPGQFPDSLRPYCGESPRMQVRLDDRYLESRIPIVERQLLKGGLRLAAFLDRLFAQSQRRQGQSTAESVLAPFAR